jgi:hypothetical protein
VTGSTWSADYPTTPGAFEETINGQRDLFITRLSPAGTALEYSTFAGGASGQDEATTMALGPGGVAYAAGWTSSTDFDVTAGAYDVSYNGGGAFNWDAFVLALNDAGSELVYSTYLGGSSEDRPTGIEVDESGTAIVAGHTRSADFPTTPGAYDRTFAGGSCGPQTPCFDLTVARLSPAGDVLEYGTYVGGPGDDQASGLSLDEGGRPFITGETASGAAFPTTADGFDTTPNGLSDAFVIALADDAASLSYGTFLGGQEEDRGLDLWAQNAGSVYVVGRTRSADFPVTPGSHDPEHSADYDIFAVRLDFPAVTGTLQGTVRDAATGLPIPGATVVADDGAGQFTATADDQGFYQLELEAGPYDLSASAAGYQTATVAVEVVAGEVTVADFLLDPDVEPVTYDLYLPLLTRP